MTVAGGGKGPQPGLDDGALSPHARINRESWNEVSLTYQLDHGPQLAGSGGLGWGVWQIPEAKLQVLGEVEGRDVLELGCGAAQWSIALAKRGARTVGLDVSENQLEHARRLMEAAGIEFPLVHASAEAVPLPDESFDIVFCDWGATAFTDPYRTIPEAARLLRPGGLLAFSGSTAIQVLCLILEQEVPGAELVRDYFGLKAVIDEDWVEFMLPYGEWIRLFRGNGLDVEDLIELRPAAAAVSTYVTDEVHDWARRWPYEQIWKVRKRG